MNASAAGRGIRRPAPSPVCPVCHRPDTGAVTCAQCSQTLRGGYVLGAATPADRSDLEASLADCRQRYDLRAAARAAGAPGGLDSELLDDLAVLARGGRPSPERIRDAVAEVEAADPPVSVTSAGLMFTLTRLVTGKSEAIAFVEVGPDAIAVQTLVAGPLGVPRLQAHEAIQWTDVLPLLPENPDLRRLRMAGGIGEAPDGPANADEADAAPTPALIAEAIVPALNKLMAAAAAAAASSRLHGSPGAGNSLRPRVPRRVDIVLVRRPLRWPVLETALAQARTVLRPVAELVVPLAEGDLETVVDAVAQRAPLRHGYELVLVDVNADNGAVSVKPYPLFGAGIAVTPDEPPTVTVPLAVVAGHAAAQVALPIVARRGPAPPYREPELVRQTRPLVELAALNGSVPGETELRVTLHGPGNLEMHAVPELLSGHAIRAHWLELITMLPDQVPRTWVPAGGLDIVVLVELGGAEDVVAERVRLARDTIREFRGEPGVRVSVLGHRDHFGRYRVDAIGKPGEDREALVVGCPLTAPSEAWAAFGRAERWEAVPVVDRQVAPVEDALQIVAGSRWDWRPEARHVLLTIGGRVPHPPREPRYGEGMLPCPHHYSWESALDRLAAAQTVEPWAVRDGQENLKSSYVREAWRRLGARPDLWSGKVTAAQLARMIGQAPQAAAVEIGLARHATVAPTASHEGGAGV
jgi:hypothetical protein